MIWLYRILFPCVLLVLSPRYLLRMRRRGGYQSGFSQRFGFVPIPGPKKGLRIWLQAVSVGEMLAIEPILRALSSDGAEVYLSTTTSTGYRQAQDRYLGLVSGLSYFPLDWQPFSSLAWDRINPDLSILTEGERWPEHMRQASLRKVPVLCINGRISDRSFNRLRGFPLAAGLMLGGIKRLLASSAQDAERFTALGFPAERLAMTGNIKLDVSIPLIDSARKQALRAELGLPGQGLILLGSSTWPGEEDVLIGALRAVRAKGISAFLLIVPRHAERRNEIRKLLGGTEFRHHFRSGGPASGEVDVAVADTTGELRLLTQLADLVMVGKSLAPHTQGQTPVEAAILGKPILCGPGMGNFRQITAELVGLGAARQLSGAFEIGDAAAQLLGDPSARGRMSDAGELWRRKNSGAVERTLAVVREELRATAGRSA